MVCLQKEVYLENPPAEGDIHIFVGKKISRCGYGWLFPKRHGYTVGVGSLATYLTGARALSESLYWLLKRHPTCSALVKNAKNISEPKVGYIPISQHRTLSRSGLVTVGDAAGQVSPNTGGGIYYAMKAAEIASEVIVQSLEIGDSSVDFLRRYNSEWKATLGKDLYFERLLTLHRLARTYVTRKQELDLLNPCRIRAFLSESFAPIFLRQLLNQKRD